MIQEACFVLTFFLQIFVSDSVLYPKRAIFSATASLKWLISLLERIA